MTFYHLYGSVNNKAIAVPFPNLSGQHTSVNGIRKNDELTGVTDLLKDYLFNLNFYFILKVCPLLDKKFFCPFFQGPVRKVRTTSDTLVASIVVVIQRRSFLVLKVLSYLCLLVSIGDCAAYCIMIRVIGRVSDH